MEHLADILGQSDVDTLHCPVTTDTGGLACLKPRAILVNTARGELLEATLRSGRLAAAAIDTLAQEPPGQHSLLSAWRSREDWLAGRLIITPHLHSIPIMRRSKCVPMQQGR
ncbi:MAG: NAD(P)-dependent oxidoreductase [Rhizobium sp.]|uniref:NAD(P)-dependent oxidoreductase n=1 Tax=Rhizobium sp. SYY.PMSO TaxID=3382192 RepID=UPI00398F9005